MSLKFTPAEYIRQDELGYSSFYKLLRRSDGELSETGSGERYVDGVGNFRFNDDVKKIRIDIGLSKEAYHSVQWLNTTKDVGIIGVEAHPDCVDSLNYGLSTNGYSTGLFLYRNKTVKYVGQISEIFLKKEILGWELSPNSADNTSAWPGDLTFEPFKDGAEIIVSPWPIHDAEGCFRSAPVLIPVSDIKDRYILLWGAIDDIKGEEEVITQKFFGAYPNVGASSLIEDNFSVTDQKLHKIWNVPSYRLESVLRHIDWDRFPFIECIKIDVEGKELDVLKSCGMYLDRVVYIRAEAFKDRAGTTKSEDLLEFMESCNFELFDDEEGDYKFINNKYKDLARKMSLGY